MVTADGIDLPYIGMNNSKMGMGFSLRGDLDGDNVVAVTDVLLLLSAFGTLCL